MRLGHRAILWPLLSAVIMSCGASGANDDPAASNGGADTSGGGTGGSKQGPSGKSGADNGTGGKPATGVSAELTWSSELLVDEDQYPTTSPGLAMDAEGNAWVAWLRDVSGEQEVRVRHYDAASDSWGEEQKLNAPTGSLRSLTMSGTPSGDAVLAWELRPTPTTSSIQAATYTAADGAWSDAVELALLDETSTTSALRTAQAADGTAAVGWVEQAYEPVKNSADFITSTLIHSLLNVRKSDGAGSFAAATAAWQGDVSLQGAWDQVPASQRIPSTSVALTFTAEGGLWALVGATSGIHVTSEEDGAWSEPSTLDERGSFQVQAASLANGSVQGAWLTEGDVMVSELTPKDGTWSAPERIEKITAGASSLSLATGSDGSPVEAALTWTVGSEFGSDSNSYSYAARRTAGSWEEPTKFDGFARGVPRVGIAASGETIVVSGGLSLWWAQAASDAAWEAYPTNVPSQQNIAPRAVLLAVAPSRLTLAVWVDAGHDQDLKDHLLAIVGR